MKYYLIAGEPSGDLHGSNLIKSLKSYDNNAEFRYYGGDLMQKQGGVLVKHYRDTAIMGFIRVAFNLHKILKHLSECKIDIKEYNPDIVILIDYPGFNLRIAKYVKQYLNLPVHYYIPPKVWAWKEGRVNKIKKYVDAIYAIFPFELDFYAKHNCKAIYVGNPSVQSVSSVNAQHQDKNEFYSKNLLSQDKKIIALLAGSRKQEVLSCLPVMNTISTEKFKDYQFVLAATSAIDKTFYSTVAPHIKIVYDQTYSLMRFADAALVNSGTATLETALFRLPQVVCYQISIPYIAYPILKYILVKIPYVSLVNIIAKKFVVKELLAINYTAKNCEDELFELLFNINYRNQILADYDDIIKNLGTDIASDHAAKLITKKLK